MELKLYLTLNTERISCVNLTFQDVMQHTIVVFSILINNMINNIFKEPKLLFQARYELIHI